MVMVCEVVVRELPVAEIKHGYQTLQRQQASAESIASAFTLGRRVQLSRLADNEMALQPCPNDSGSCHITISACDGPVTDHSKAGYDGLLTV